MKSRVMVLCTDTGVRVPDNSGASMHLMAITKAFASLGCEVLLVGIKGEGEVPASISTQLFAQPGCAEGLRRELNTIELVEQVRRSMSDVVDRFHPDIVYERLSLFGTAGHDLARRVGAAHIVEVNALLSKDEATWRELHLVRQAADNEREVLRGAAVRVAVSAEAAADIELVAPGRPTVVVPNGVDTAAFAELPDRVASRRRLDLPLGSPVVAFVGALRPGHGLDIAIEAIAAVPDATLAVAGDGPIRDELSLMAIGLKLSARIRWLGALPHSDVVSLLAASDAAIAPYPALSRFSHAPVKIYEYLAAGVPVIASDIGQIRATLEAGRFGTLVPPGDADALAQAIDGVLSDPTWARHRAVQARRYALSHHGWADRARVILGAVDLPRRPLRLVSANAVAR